MRSLAGLTASMLGQGAGLGVLEHAMRAALAASGARLLEAVLAGESGYQGPRADCGHGHQAGYAGCRAKTVTTVLGPVQVTRAWYHCQQCGHGLAPRDEQLGVAGTSLSPGLAEMTARAGAEVPFGKAAALLADLAGITMNAKTIERAAEAAGAAARAAGTAEAAALRAREILPLPPLPPVPDMLYVETDGTGVPVRASETAGRQGKAEDGTARTREIKLARLFTQSGPDSKGRPVMDPGSSSYVATFDGRDTLAGLVGAEYLRRGGDHFRQVVALGDGAAWIWTMAEALYPHATHIVDIYHAREHLHDLAAHLAFITPDPPQWLAGRLDELDAGDIEAIIGAARACPQCQMVLSWWVYELVRQRGGGGGVSLVQAYRFALDPSAAQERALRSHAGAARFAWNWGLAKCQERYAAEGTWYSAVDLHRLWNAQKKADPALGWWGENSKCAYQEAFRDLDRALRDFTASRAGQRKGRRLGFPPV